ncbi:MAG: PadR family transcriptional regulator [Acidimicrobiales bacterium]
MARRRLPGPAEQETLAGPPLLILTSLASGPKHGHMLMKDIDRFAMVRLGPGTLYGAISRLEQRGLIAPLPVGERRRPYELTPRGATVLGASIAQLGRVVHEGESRLRLLGRRRPLLGPAIAGDAG